MEKELVISQLKAIASLNTLARKLEEVMGVSTSESAFDYCISEFVSVLIEAVGISPLSWEADNIGDMLFSMDNSSDFEYIYGEMIKVRDNV